MSGRQSASGSAARNKPYALVGSGRLTASVWKSGSKERGWRYRFTLHRTDAGSGRVTKSLRPTDVLDLPKLVQVLAFLLADDGCLDPELRERLWRLVERLDELTGGELGHGKELP